jgi:hypothetical protein
MRFLAVFLVTLVLAITGCSHKKAKPAPAPTSPFSTLPGVDAGAAQRTASAPATTPATPPEREIKVVPFGAPTTPPPPVTAPVDTAANAAPTTPAAPNAGKQKLIVTPDQGFLGKVATVNDTARFVIVTFPAGHVPPIDQTLTVYRHGLKVGELKVTEPQRDEFTAADIVTGETAVGDEVRDK